MGNNVANIRSKVRPVSFRRQENIGHEYRNSRIICKILKDVVKPSVDQAAFDNQVANAMAVCDAANDFDGIGKVTIKDLDVFYSDRTNQPISLEWTMM